MVRGFVTGLLSALPLAAGVYLTCEAVEHHQPGRLVFIGFVIAMAGLRIFGKDRWTGHLPLPPASLLLLVACAATSVYAVFLIVAELTSPGRSLVYACLLLVGAAFPALIVGLGVASIVKSRRVSHGTPAGR
jgi:hypothetical protein